MITLLFICGSLEPGKNGVGDYVRLLASRLQGQGFSCVCLSLSDDHVTKNPEVIFHPFESHLVKFFRIPAKTSWNEKFSILENITKFYDPFFISLQYVPYSFSARGIPVKLLNWLPRLTYKHYWHIMFHELWVDPSLKFSNSLLEPIQKLVLKKLVSRLNPKIIHTTNLFYQMQLRNIGVASQLLPLFSNIRYAKNPTPAFKAHSWNFIFFGSIHAGWDYQALLDAIEIERKNANIPECSFIFLGQIGTYGEMLWSRLIQNKTNTYKFKKVSYLPQNQVSYYLQDANFGISTTPSHLLEKSGSVAAMLNHGLPVIVVRPTPMMNCYNTFLESTGRYILFDPNKPLALSSRSSFEPVDQLDITTYLISNSFLSCK